MIDTMLIINPFNKDTNFYNNLCTKYLQLKALDAMGKTTDNGDIKEQLKEHIEQIEKWQSENAEYFI